jgi:PAS fold/Diguanylate cyclase, GGDEF domain
MIELHPELARSIVDGLPAGIAVIDADGHVVWANRVLSELMQRDTAEIIGRSAESLALPLPQRDTREAPTDACRISEMGNLIGISRGVRSSNFHGSALLVIDRGNAIDWFFDALSTGGFDGSVASRFLSRNSLFNRLQLEVSRSRRYANPLSCLVIRIDFGARESGRRRRAVHDLIACTLKELLRWVDVLGQWSDQALVVVLPETTGAAAKQLAEKVACALHPDLADEAPTVTINVGSSSWRKGDDAEGLIRRADIVARRQNGSTARTISF